MGIRSLLALLAFGTLTACHRPALAGRNGAVWTLVCRDAAARDMALVSDFTAWAPVAATFRQERNGEWVVRFEAPQPGTYRVQCLADGRRRSAPVGLDLLENDGFGGENGVLFVPPGDFATPRALDQERKQ